MTDRPEAAGPESEPEEESVELTVEAVLDVLDDGDMVDTLGMLRYSSNYTFMVTMQKDDVELPAVYKPRKGERPLWDFPDGTLCNRERAAYLTSAELGWDIVPPTSLRDGVHGIGSVQFYINHDPNVNYFSFDDGVAPQLARIALFDVLINNADRKGGHLLLDGQGQVWGIDHGIAFNEDHKLRSVIWDFAGQQIPKPFMDDVEMLCGTLSDMNGDYRKRMDGLLLPREIDAFQRRIDRVINTRRYPNPGPGPNYPWPAV
ncbi:MAG: SCO1664 family protein [Chloroflexota bacterium]